MTHLLFGFGFTFITALIVIIGDTAIKFAADGDQPMWSGLVVLGCILYAISALFWFFAMQHVTLVQAGVAFSMITLLALALIGALWFGEKLYVREYAGLACALAAMVLLARIA